MVRIRLVLGLILILFLISSCERYEVKYTDMNWTGAIPVTIIEIYHTERYNVSCVTFEEVFSINMSDATNCSIEISHHPVEADKE